MALILTLTTLLLTVVSFYGSLGNPSSFGANGKYLEVRVRVWSLGLPQIYYTECRIRDCRAHTEKCEEATNPSSVSQTHTSS